MNNLGPKRQYLVKHVQEWMSNDGQKETSKKIRSDLDVKKGLNCDFSNFLIELFAQAYAIY